MVKIEVSVQQENASHSCICKYCIHSIKLWTVYCRQYIKEGGPSERNIDQLGLRL